MVPAVHWFQNPHYHKNLMVLMLQIPPCRVDCVVKANGARGMFLIKLIVVHYKSFYNN